MRMRRQHARQMRGAAGTGDNHGKTRLFGSFGKSCQPRRGAVRRNNFDLIGRSQIIQNGGGALHGLPIRLAAHANGYFSRGFLRSGAHNNLIIDLSANVLSAFCAINASRRAMTLTLKSLQDFHLSGNNIWQNSAAELGYFVF